MVHHYDFPCGSVFDGLLLGTYTITEADSVIHSAGISFENVIEAEPAFNDLSGRAGDDLIIANEAGDYIVGGADNNFDNEKKTVNSACLRNGNGVSLAYRKAA